MAASGLDAKVERIGIHGCANSHEFLVVVTFLLGSSRPRMDAQQSQLTGGFLEKSRNLHKTGTKMERGDARGSARHVRRATKTD